MAAGLPPSCSHALGRSLPQKKRGGRGFRGGSFWLDQRRQSFVERFSSLGKHNPILRPLRSGKARLDRGEIKRQEFGVFGLRSFLVVKKSLLAAVSFDERDLLRAASAEL